MRPDAWPLVGRAAAIEATSTALGEGPPQSLVIVGGAGVGRTRMAREALTWAERHGRATLWAAATAPAAHVPLGALAHLIPTLEEAADPLVLLKRATQAVVEAGPAPVLGVDDVHLLDRLSITLLHQLAATGEVSLVLTVRTGDGVPDPAAPLWKDGFATRVDLWPLGRAETEQLVSTVLDGDVETRTTERIWRLARGNPLYVREVVEEGRRQGRLTSSEGLWRWQGSMTPSPRLAEIVLAQLGNLEPEEWQALEVLATAEPLSAQHLMDLSGPDVVAALARRGLIRDGGTGSGELCTSHPVQAAVLRGRASEAAQRLVRHRLGAPVPRPRQGEHSVGWCLAVLDSDLPAPPVAELTGAAEQALARLNLPAAERLSRAACAAGGDVPAHLVLAEATRWLGNPERSLQVAAEAARLVTNDVDRARVSVSHALTLLCGQGRAAEASAVLEATAAAVCDGEAHALLAAADRSCRFLRGAPPELPAGATSELEGAESPLALAASAVERATAARTTDALTLARTGWLALEAEPQAAETVLARILLQHAEVVALHLAGRMEDLERRAVEFHRLNLAVPEWSGDSVAALHCGWAALARGQGRRAIRWLVEAHAGLQRRDVLGMGELCRALLALARGVLGDVNGSSADADPPTRTAIAAFVPYTALGDACAVAMGGRSAEAGRLVLAAGHSALRQGHTAAAALMFHHTLRYGLATAAVQPLTALAEDVDAPLVTLFADHARALAAEDAERLAETSARFQRSGALLFAADAAVEAAALHDRTGARRAAAECRARGLTLARECGLSDGPALAAVALPTLTSREEEVATLAGSGWSNQEIADRLVVSVRTVEAHLSHVYTKFGIASRSDLVVALGTTVPTPRRPASMPGTGLVARF